MWHNKEARFQAIFYRVERVERFSGPPSVRSLVARSRTPNHPSTALPRANKNPSHGRRGCTNDETAIGKAASAKHRLRTPTAPVIASWHPWHRREATACHAARAISPLGEPSASSQTARGEPKSRRRSLPPEMMQPAGMRQHLRRTGLVFLQELIEHCRPARITPFRGSHDTAAGHVRRSGSVRCLDLPLQGPVPKGTTQLTSQWVANQRNLLGGPGLTDAPTGLIADVLHIGRDAGGLPINGSSRQVTRTTRDANGARATPDSGWWKDGAYRSRYRPRSM